MKAVIPHRSVPSRSGMTLLEIVLAMALFLGAISVLAQIVWTGHQASAQARLRTEAVFRCETKLAEILAGAAPFQSSQGVSFSDDSQWTWSANIQSGQYPELLHLAVTVRHQGNNPSANAEFTLERWTRDPMLFIEAAQAQSQSTTSTMSTSTSSGNSGGQK